jgi:c-di-GMP-binding flagellar brake protein YcgR
MGKWIDQVIASGINCGISFRNGETKLVFSTLAMRRDAQHRINDKLNVEALLMRRPAQVKSVQRRDHYRAHIPLNSPWPAVKVWRMGMKAELSDRPMDAQAIHTQIRDLSATGMGAIFSGEGNAPPKFTPSDRLRIELNNQGQILLLEGKIRYPLQPPTEPSVRVGIQFAGLDDTVENRKIKSDLIRLVGDLQREEIRRHRMGLSPD